MKAIVCPRYGPPEVLEQREVTKPTCQDNEILVRIEATTVTQADLRVRAFRVPPSFWIPARLVIGVTKPKKPVLGTELAGVVENIGKDIKKFKVGDQVFALTGHDFGCYAEYRCVAEDGIIALKSKNMSYRRSCRLTYGWVDGIAFSEERKREERSEGLGLRCIG